jgi:hypothetical protein
MIMTMIILILFHRQNLKHAMNSKATRIPWPLLIKLYKILYILIP